MSINERAKIKKMTQLAVLMGLIVVLQAASTLISRVTVLPFNLTLTLIPIIVGALLYGVLAGAWLGLFFGMIVALYAFTGFDPSCTILIEENAFFFILVCLGKGAAAGAMAGVAGLIFRKNGWLAALLAAVVTPLTNTGLFVVGMRFLFYPVMVAIGDSYIQQGHSVLYFIIVGLALINFLVELGINVAFSPLVKRVVSFVKKD